MKPVSRYLRITKELPIYRAMIHLNISTDICDARIQQNKMLGDFIPEPGVYYVGMMSWRSHHYGVFFSYDRLIHGVIAHECFHMAHRIMEHVGAHYHDDSPEPHAYLMQYLTQWVYDEIKKRKIRVVQWRPLSGSIKSCVSSSQNGSTNALIWAPTTKPLKGGSILTASRLPATKTQ